MSASTPGPFEEAFADLSSAAYIASTWAARNEDAREIVACIDNARAILDAAPELLEAAKAAAALLEGMEEPGDIPTVEWQALRAAIDKAEQRSP